MTTATKRESIFDLGESYQILSSWFVETEGEVTPELEQLWNEWSEKFETKVEHSALFICELDGIADMIDEQIAKLAARRDARRNGAKRLKVILQAKLEQVGKTKVEGTLKTVALQKNPPSVKPLLEPDVAWELHEALRNRFLRVIPQKVEWDKRAMLDAWKQDATVLAAIALVEQGMSLRIR